MPNQNIMEHVNDEIQEKEQGSGLGMLLPVLMLAFLAAAVWYLMGINSNAKHEEHATEAATEKVIKTNEAVAKIAGKVDTLSGDFVYELGNIVSIDLPNGAGKLEVGENSTENKLVKFLLNKAAGIDSVKGNWFEFTNVRFKTGGTQIDSASLIQIKNMVAITKGFPVAQFKIGGYTDNTGDTAKNISLSQKRAEAVLAALKKQGAVAASFTGAKGYGPEHPIGDNAIAEGRAMNRRVAVNVKAK